MSGAGGAGALPRDLSRLANPEKTLRRPKTTAFLCSLATAAVFVLPLVLAQGGVLYVSNDQITQQLPLTQQIVRNLHGGNWAYDFTLDLGSGVVEGYTWYNLGSVFSLVQYLFPAALTPYLLGPMLILKFGFAGLFAFLWMRRHTRTDYAALVGSVCYAFAGIAISNMVFPFEDVYALFPLLPLGMDYLFDGKYPGFFALAVALNVLVNPPLFFGAAVFMVLYFCVKWFYRAYTVTLKSFGRLALQAVLGVLVSGFILVPFVASLAANPRVEGTLAFGRDWFIYVAYRYFELFRSLVLPAEVMHKNSMFLLHDAVSPEGYLPLFGLVPVFAYVAHKRRDWLRGLLLASLGCMLIPVLNSAFNAFNTTYYTRWLYMPMLAAALAVALFLEDGAIPLKKGYAVWGLFAALLVVCVVLWCTVFGYGGFITYAPAFASNLAVCLLGLAATGFVPKYWKKLPALVLAGVCLFSAGTGALNLAFNQKEATEAYGDLRLIPRNYLNAGKTTPLPEGVYRINAPIANQYFGHGSPFSFNSTVSAGIFELQAAFGRQRTSTSIIEYSEPGLWALLGVEYILVDSPEEEVPLPNTRFYAEGAPYSVVENLDALPLVMGYSAVAEPAAGDPLETLDNTQKSIAMLHALVPGSNEAHASLAAMGLATESHNTLAAASYEDGVAARKAMAATDVVLQNDGLAATLAMPQAGAALITLPYDEGWRCMVDGEETPLVKVQYGLMAAACPEGTHTIQLVYRPTGGTLGLVCTLIGLAGIAGTILLARRKKRATARA